MAQKVNISLDQGSTFTTAFTLNDDVTGLPLDLSTSTGRAQMRRHYTSSSYYTFNVTTSNNGVVTLSMSSNTTDGITAGRYVYDVELTDASNNVSRVVEGVVTVTPQVTK